ncbi:hypothetical protein DERP_002918 [Dermatophagoides pteronyssinus]|uniref:Uncharacterized protein n=1 Tax=Dermatophagoides pteronyssinus TaxID=6956 RepID=A0ABQ8JW28_DERPT|nr:hypothetical protein DERP_002918 [Dermatophagoides pteronyssinus]
MPSCDQNTDSNRGFTRPIRISLYLRSNQENFFFIYNKMHPYNINNRSIFPIDTYMVPVCGSTMAMVFDL